MNENSLNHFLETVYGAVGQEDFWKSTISSLSGCVDGGVAEISAYGEAAGDCELFVVPDHIDRSSIDKYQQHYIQDDLRMRSVMRCHGKLVPCQELVDVKTFEKTEIVNDFLDSRDLDLRWCAAHFERTHPEGGVLVSIMRPHSLGAFQGKEVETINILTAHLHKAIRLHRDLRAASIDTTRLHLSFENIGDGVLICDRACRIIHMNSTAENIIEAIRGLNFSDGVLKAHASDSAAQAFQKTVWYAAEPFALQDAADPGFAALPRPGNLPIIARAYPLPRDEADCEYGPRAEVLVILRDPARPTPLNLRALSLMGLTRAEVALTEALAMGMTLSEHAKNRKVSNETVRSQLKSALSKLGVRRQSDLVRIASRCGI